MKVISKKSYMVMVFCNPKKKSMEEVRRFGGTPKSKYSKDRA